MKSNREIQVSSIGHVLYSDESNIPDILEFNGYFKGKINSAQELKQKLISSYPNRIKNSDEIIHCICVDNQFNIQIRRKPDSFQPLVMRNQIIDKKDNIDYQTQEIGFLGIFNILKFVCLPEKIEEWMGDTHESIESQIKDKNYPQWRIRLMYTQEILILICSSIQLKVYDRLLSWFKRLSS